MTSLLEPLDAYLDEAPRGSCEVETVGPFHLFFHRLSDHPFLSYARPAGALEGDLGPPIALVRRRFEERGRRCRWEFLEERAPALVPALAAAGFPEPARHPLMTLVEGELRREEVPGLVVRRVRQDDDLRALRSLAARAFGDGEITDADVEAMRDSLQRSRVFAAFMGDRPVATGTHIPIGTLSEVAGIAVDPTSWGRRIGGAVVATVSADVFASGCSAAFLMAADGRASRLYGRIGYRSVGTAVGVMAPES
ncbi:GNAT family N-acetyltransferase [Polyangium aurulentum]|uniref:GNAT family N-acetyltransferase n=1 Tax=Polyangium aurulentum TaxID=2567896 RepID=UPI0010ADE38D|nr:GNAT family N-acetyltransferase [Polyangium aurulentum]UQA63030.1 GNAT family N-acetyltransferase [Polyangium aurulentum]